MLVFYGVYTGKDKNCRVNSMAFTLFKMIGSSSINNLLRFSEPALWEPCNMQ